jgi:hypothetical protein
MPHATQRASGSWCKTRHQRSVSDRPRPNRLCTRAEESEARIDRNTSIRMNACGSRRLRELPDDALFKEEVLRPEPFECAP